MRRVPKSARKGRGAAVRLVVDTNILVSALLNKASKAAQLLEAWERRRFDVVTCREQLDELTRVTRYPKLSKHIAAVEADSLRSQLKDVAIFFEELPTVEASPDPDDNWLLGLAEIGEADYLVSGDKRDVLKLAEYQGTKIVSLVSMISLLSLET
jgi:uncharacterized protein